MRRGGESVFDDYDGNYTDERLVMSTKREEDAEENVLRPKTMAEYVGQQKLKDNLKKTMVE